MFPVWEGGGRRERTQEEIPFLMWWIPGGTLVVSYYFSFSIHLTTLQTVQLQSDPWSPLVLKGKSLILTAFFSLFLFLPLAICSNIFSKHLCCMVLYVLFLCTSASQSIWVFSAAIECPAVSLKLSHVVTHKNPSGNASQAACILAL